MNVGEERLTSTAFTGFLGTFANSISTTTPVITGFTANSEFGKRKSITDFVKMRFYLLFPLFIILPEPRLEAQRSARYVFKITSSENITCVRTVISVWRYIPSGFICIVFRGLNRGSQLNLPFVVRHGLFDFGFFTCDCQAMIK